MESGELSLQNRAVAESGSVPFLHCFRGDEASRPLRDCPKDGLRRAKMFVFTSCLFFHAPYKGAIFSLNEEKWPRRARTSLGVLATARPTSLC